MTPRPSLYLAAASRAYPTAWRDYARILADPPAPWPRWCFCPLAAAYAVVSGGGAIDPRRAGHIGALGALAAWRATQGIYRYDATVARALVETPLDRAIPAEALERLPEWAPYIEIPDGLGDGIAGGWLHLEHDAGDGRREMRLVLDRADYQPTGQPRDLDALVAIAIHLRPGATLIDGLRHYQSEATRQAIALGAGDEAMRAITGEDFARAQPLVAPLLSLALYLCAEKPELYDERTGATAPPRQRPPPVRLIKGDPRFLPPAGPSVWQTAYHLGRVLRDAESHGGTHAGPRPHVRRAHWHTFLHGPRDGQQERRLRWLPPIPVGLDDGPDRPTIREVDP